MPIATVIGAVIWIIIFIGTRYVSVASVTAAIALPVVILMMISISQAHTGALFYFAICIAAVVVWRHRSNLSRLARGTEPRFERK